MKTLLIGAALLLALNTTAQVVREDRSQTKELYRGSFSMNLTRFTVKDTTFALYFQNRKYSTLTDIEYISFKSKKDLTDFLIIALEALESTEMISIQVGTQQVYLAKTVNGVYVSVKDAYFILPKRDIDAMLNVIQ